MIAGGVAHTSVDTTVPSKARPVKIALILIVLFVALAGGGAWYFNRGTAQAATFRTAEVKRGDLVTTIDATGTVEPEELIDVGAQVAGRIIEFGTDTNGKQVDYGSRVEKGKLLAKIDDSIYLAEVAQARAQLMSSEAGVKRAEADLQQMQAKLYQAERDWKRAELLGPSDALSHVSYDAYKSAYEVARANIAVGDAAIIQAKAEVDQAQSNLERAERNLTYCTINSPVTGVIIDRRVNIGQTVVASLNAPSLFLIAQDLRRMQVWVAVNEADIGSIREGQPVSFEVDAFQGHAFRGEVNKVRLNAAMTQNVVTYTVEVSTDNSDAKLLPYLTANVHFEVERHDDVLSVPNAALRYTPRAEQMHPDVRSEYASAEGGGGPGAGGARGRGPGGGGGPGAAPGGGGGGGGGRADAAMAGGPAGGRRRGTTRPSGGESPGGVRLRPATLWVRDGEFLRPVKVMAGATDEVETEVRGEGVREGLEVVVGEVIAEQGGGASQTTNPFAPPRFGGPRRGGGGGGGPGGGGGGRGGGGRGG